MRPANDTSAAVGYYPLSPTEKTVLELEQFLNSKKFKQKYPETGEDIKVMGLRRENVLDLTVAMPLLADYIKSEKNYFERKQAIHDVMESFLERFEGSRKEMCILIPLMKGAGGSEAYISVFWELQQRMQIQDRLEGAIE